MTGVDHLDQEVQSLARQVVVETASILQLIEDVEL